MATYSNLKFITGVAGENLRDKQSRLIKFDGTSFTTCGSGDTAFGVVFAGSNSGGHTTVTYRGNMVVEAGGTFSAGDNLQSDAQGRVIAHGTGVIVGVALSNGLVGQKVQVQFLGLSGNGEAPQTTPTDGPETVTIAEFTAPVNIYDLGRAEGNNTAQVPLSGTASTDGLPIYARHGISGAWVQVSSGATGGNWTGTLPLAEYSGFDVIQVLQSDGTTQQTTGTCSSGNVIAIFGQSEVAYMSSIANTPTPPVGYSVTGTGAVWHGNLQNNGGTVTQVTTASSHRYPIKAMTNALLEADPNGVYLILDHTWAASNPLLVVDDSTAINRRFTVNDAPMAAQFSDDGIAPGVKYWMWWTSTGPVSAWKETLAPVIFGKSIDGTDFTRGNTVDAGTDFGTGSNLFAVDNFFQDLYGGSGKWAFVHQHIHSADPVTRYVDAEDFGIVSEIDALLLSSDTFAQPMQVYETTEADRVHPAITEDGIVRAGRNWAGIIMQTVNKGPITTIPEIDSVTWASDKITISSSEGDFTTLRALNSETDGDANPAVVGFQVNGTDVNASIVGGNIEIPGTFTGSDTLSLIQASAGFDNIGGDPINWYRRIPLIATPTLTEIDGMPIRRLADTTWASTLPAETDFSALSGSDAYLSPTIPVNTKSILVRVDVSYLTDAFTNLFLFDRLGGNFGLSRAFNGRVSGTLAGASVNSTATGLIGFTGTPPENVNIIASAALDGTDATLRVWVNGVRVINDTRTNATTFGAGLNSLTGELSGGGHAEGDNKTWRTIQYATATDTGLLVNSVDGSTPPDLSGVTWTETITSAAEANASPMKRGTDLFTS